MSSMLHSSHHCWMRSSTGLPSLRLMQCIRQVSWTSKPRLFSLSTSSSFTTSQVSSHSNRHFSSATKKYDEDALPPASHSFADTSSSSSSTFSDDSSSSSSSSTSSSTFPFTSWCGGSLSDVSSTILHTSICDASLRHISEYGWTVHAIGAGIKDLGLSSTATTGLLKKGPVELVYRVMEKAQEHVEQTMKHNGSENLSVNEKLELALRLRLEATLPYISSWPTAIALSLEPQNLSTTLEKLALMADDIWHIVGDKSTDMTWYSKRALITSVYLSTELYMLTDRSMNFQSTWNFLHRQIMNVQDVHSLPSQAIQGVKYATNLLFSFLGSNNNIHTSHHQYAQYQTQQPNTSSNSSSPATPTVSATSTNNTTPN